MIYDIKLEAYVAAENKKHHTNPSKVARKVSEQCLERILYCVQIYADVAYV